VILIRVRHILSRLCRLQRHDKYYCAVLQASFKEGISSSPSDEKDKDRLPIRALGGCKNAGACDGAGCNGVHGWVGWCSCSWRCVLRRAQNRGRGTYGNAISGACRAVFKPAGGHFFAVGRAGALLGLVCATKLNPVYP
jgi:hypothetical protein